MVETAIALTKITAEHSLSGIVFLVEKSCNSFCYITLILGTFQAENEPVVYGLTHPINTWDPVRAQVSEF